MITHYRLSTDDHTVNAKRNGDQWHVEIISHDSPGEHIKPWRVQYKTFPATGAPDQGMLVVARTLRREFNIAGTYQPQEG